MKTELLIGKCEQHKVTIEQLLTGGVVVKVDGRQMLKGTLTKRKPLELIIGVQEKHCIKIRKRKGGFARWNIQIDNDVLPTDLFAEYEGMVATARMCILLISGWTMIIAGVLFAVSGGQWVDEEEKGLSIGLIAQFIIFLILFFGTWIKNRIIVFCCFLAANILLCAGILFTLAYSRFGGSIIISIILLIAILRGNIAFWRINQMIKTKYVPEGVWPEFVRFVQRDR